MIAYVPTNTLPNRYAPLESVLASVFDSCGNIGQFDIRVRHNRPGGVKNRTDDISVGCLPKAPRCKDNTA